jgi:hypothetical protein
MSNAQRGDQCHGGPFKPVARARPVRLTRINRIQRRRIRIDASFGAAGTGRSGVAIGGPFDVLREKPPLLGVEQSTDSRRRRPSVGGFLLLTKNWISGAR